MGSNAAETETGHRWKFQAQVAGTGIKSYLWFLNFCEKNLFLKISTFKFYFEESSKAGSWELPLKINGGGRKKKTTLWSLLILHMDNNGCRG